MWNFKKNGTEEFTYRAAMEKQAQRIDLWTWGEGEMYGKSNMETYITICKIDSQWEFAVQLRRLKQGLYTTFFSPENLFLISNLNVL